MSKKNYNELLNELNKKVENKASFADVNASIKAINEELKQVNDAQKRSDFTVFMKADNPLATMIVQKDLSKLVLKAPSKDELYYTVDTADYQVDLVEFNKFIHGEEDWVWAMKAARIQFGCAKIEEFFSDGTADEKKAASGYSRELAQTKVYKEYVENKAKLKAGAKVTNLTSNTSLIKAIQEIVDAMPDVSCKVRGTDIKYIKENMLKRRASGVMGLPTDREFGRIIMDVLHIELTGKKYQVVTAEQKLEDVLGARYKPVVEDDEPLQAEPVAAAE